MRNTRTAAACVAAATLLGLLSATPAMAGQLDGGAGGIVQREESPGSGLGLLGHSVTDVPAGPSDRGEAAMSGNVQPGGPDVRELGHPSREVPTVPAPTPTPIEPALADTAAEPAAATESTAAAPGAASTAQPPLVIAELSDDGALVSLSDDLYRSEKRIVVIVEGRPVAQIQNKQTRGVTKVVPDVVDGRSVLLIPGVKPGDRMAVTEYTGSLDDGFDDSLRRTRLFAARLGDAVPTTAETVPEGAPIAQQPFVIATLSDEGVLVSVSDDLYRTDKRFVVIVEGKPVAQIQNKQTRGVLRVVPDVVEGRTVLYIPGVKPGDRMAVTEYAGSLDDGFDDSLRRTRLYAAQLGDALPATAPSAPAA
ncbi:hypothetical protein EDF54_2739 [Rathayibacter sp. PhB93]|uniref:hypothetical protein n=1 Tax=unclassified Rathayibacter TaxID=2609250 RepID=UPI000F46F68B|nr:MULTISPECIES: hypothetical protein [unclassified Rathayibacter]ROQ04530.1 hypothetical protein EDF54_2739 [Rathayibacter sp. PhB93]TDQ13368.1 hypothetical protein EDF17_1974 [Rathayibacter sp. PhB1]